LIFLDELEAAEEGICYIDAVESHDLTVSPAAAAMHTHAQYKNIIFFVVSIIFPFGLISPHRLCFRAWNQP